MLASYVTDNRQTILNCNPGLILEPSILLINFGQLKTFHRVWFFFFFSIGRKHTLLVDRNHINKLNKALTTQCFR